MWGWRGEGLGDRSLDEVARHRIGAKPANGPAQQLGLLATQLERFGGPEPEQVVGARPQQLPGCRAVVGHAEPTHHRHRRRGQFAFDQVGGRGDLVGDCDLGDHQLIAVWVADTGIVAQHRQTGSADCGIGLAVAPGASHGVGDDHGDGDAEPLAQPGAQGCGTGVRIDRQQR
ncbi:Uncharacterised protein [Mycobacterium tuberculosis]|nr:Uncharacterised protein [Mycobacterium tuberculosis]CKQ53982.1 Uncharacterised protein [Mycobacterium tuberculosis]CKR21023.1 Uncharacterised protein [Mycobacterium tuberculosis]CKR93178.1 Uncharacterised protein [Mycobacterium tuberculosis]CKS47288.1 Uncharacterised protein [Mycobacterium tuberculosis]